MADFGGGVHDINGDGVSRAVEVERSLNARRGRAPTDPPSNRTIAHRRDEPDFAQARLRVRSMRRSSYWYCGSLNASHDTFGFQLVNVPLGLSFQAQTCSV